MKALQGKVAMVTGAGAGIGQAVAKRFASEGAHAILVGLDPSHLELTADSIQGHGGACTLIKGDVSDAKQMERIFGQALKVKGHLDVLVNNAGVMDDFTPAADVSDDLWRRVLGTNLDGTFYGCRLAIPAMLKAGSGSIINVASIGGLQGGRAGAAYTASKHAVIGLTKSIAYTYAKTGIRCNAIAPGGVQTTIASKMKPHPFGYERMSAGIGNAVRIGQPEEIAAIALFLASDQSSLMNGAVITADAGWTAY